MRRADITIYDVEGVLIPITVPVIREWLGFLAASMDSVEQNKGWLEDVESLMVHWGAVKRNEETLKEAGSLLVELQASEPSNPIDSEVVQSLIQAGPKHDSCFRITNTSDLLLVPRVQVGVYWKMYVKKIQKDSVGNY